MYPHDQNQIQFFLPFGGNFNPDNRWVKLAGLIPWKKFESNYSKSFKGSGFGPSAKSVRVALGALIISAGSAYRESCASWQKPPRLRLLLFSS